MRFHPDIPSATLIGVGLLLGAFVAAVLVWEQRQRFIADRRYVTLTQLKMLTPLQLEEHVAKYYRRCGHRAQLTKARGDQGIDVIADGRGGRIGIQVKQYTSAVGNGAVQEVVGGLAFYGCSRGVVITTSSFTPFAKALAKANHIELIDGAAYVLLLSRQLRIANVAVTGESVEVMEHLANDQLA
jgi:restriction system protein